MLRFTRHALWLLLACAPIASAALNVGTLAANYDGKVDTKYPTGNKPQGGGCTAPSGWTESDIGAGNGDVCDSSGTWSWQNIVGANSRESMHLVSKDAGAGDVQLVARIDAGSYTGNTVGYAGLVVGLRESTAASSWFVQCRVPYAGTTAADSIYRLTSTTFETSNGAAGQTQPRWCAVTYDVSSGDLRTWESPDGSTWAQIQSTNRAMSDVIAYLGGNSNSSSATLQAESTNIGLSSSITIYTPSDPAPSAPSWASVPSQSATQGQAFSLALASYATGATSYSASGLPAGLSVNASTGLISGTPSAAGTSSVTATATNASGSTPTSFSITVASSSGDTFTIAAANTQAVWDCNSNTGWGGGRPGPGDTIVLGAGTHAAFRDFRNCNGSAAARITIRNDTSAGSQAVIQKTGTSDGGWPFALRNSSYITIDGTGKWVGAPSEGCGVNQTTLADERTCGIKITRSGSGQPNAYFKIKGSFNNVTIRGVEIDGNRTGPDTGGIGFSLHDNEYKRTANPGEWYENIIIENTWAHETNAEATYFGGNWGTGAQNEDGGGLPLRNVTQRYMLVENSGGRCFSMKSSVAGTNALHHNRCYTSGLDGPNFNLGFGHCLQVSDGYADVYANILTNCGENGIAIFINDTPTSQFSGTPSVLVENNIVHNVGVRGPGAGVGIRFDDTSTVGGRVPFNITARYNTVDTTTHQCIQVDVGGSKSVANNLLSGCGGTAISGATGSNNRTGTTGSMGYVASGSDDFHITSGSAAKDQGTGTCPATDVDGDTRPNGSACDQGADEYVP